MRGDALNDDFVDILALFLEADVRFLVVGAHALAAHGVARATGDLDLFVQPTAANAASVFAALRGFGAPVEVHGLTVEDLTRPGTVYQIGLPPRRIDILTGIDGVDFEQSWRGRETKAVSGMELGFLGLRELVENKRAAGRPKDLADVAALAELGLVEDGPD